MLALRLAHTECNTSEKRRRRKTKTAASTQPWKKQKKNGGEMREQLDEGIDWENREDVGGLGESAGGGGGR